MQTSKLKIANRESDPRLLPCTGKFVNNPSFKNSDRGNRHSTDHTLARQPDGGTMILWWTFWITSILNAIFCPPTRVTPSIGEDSNRLGFDLTGSVLRDARKLNEQHSKTDLRFLDC